jgi:hypothetical protein
MKDFLIFTYSFVKNANILFNKLKDLGYSCTIINELDFNRVYSLDCEYKNVIVYLHEPHFLPTINNLLDTKLKNAVLIQHDDTDEKNVQNWTNRVPSLIMHRELTTESKNSRGALVAPMHFAVDSIYKHTEKTIDISFIGTVTNQRRIPFINKVFELASKDLSHLKWYLDVKPVDTRTPELFKQVINSSKIALHYYGNSYDSLRIWEVISCETALLMPYMRSLSVTDLGMPFNKYHTFKDDMSDLKSCIEHLLSNNNWLKLAKESKSDYDLNHNPDKCFEYYLHNLKKVIK